jgi:Zn-dependent peptidase ImmA (M78 family)
VDEKAEFEAEQLLKTVWDAVNLGSRIPVDPIRIANELGITVYDAELEDSVSGMIIREVGGDPKIYLNRADHPNRSRFSCAHEIGHFVNATMDKKISFVDYRGPLSATGKDVGEVFANQFASALLMPRTELARDFGNGLLATAADLAWTYKVSIDAMQFRLKNLDLI